VPAVCTAQVCAAGLHSTAQHWVGTAQHSTRHALVILCIHRPLTQRPGAAGAGLRVQAPEQLVLPRQWRSHVSMHSSHHTVLTTHRRMRIIIGRMVQ
jgi:hypothetical protein